MSIESILKNGVTIIAATERLARDLRVRATLERRNSGLKVWAAPAIFSFRTWVERQWTSTWPQQQVLFSAQELSLWLFALEKSGEGEDLISKTAAARQARFTGNLVERYAISTETGAFATRDEQAFTAWYRIVRDKLSEKDWITEDQLPTDLIRKLDAGEWEPEPEIMLVGFVEETQVQSALFARLEAAGVGITRRDMLDAVNGTITAARHASRQAQYRDVACRIRTLLAETTADPSAEPPRIGVLVPNIADCRADLHAVLTEYVSPHTAIPGGERDRVPWRFSKGLPLADQPMIAAALDVLSLEPYRNSLQLLSRVVLSPHTFGEFSGTEKARLDLQFRKRGGTRFTFSAAQAMCRKGKASAEERAGTFAARFEAWLRGYDDSQISSALPSVWADWIEDILKQAGWATRDLTSEESQAHDDWLESLDILRAMDVQVQEINKGRILAWLREILTGREFQASADYLQPVQILDYWDAIALRFSHLLVLDLTAAAMPEQVRANGFLPGDRLAAAGVPNSTPEAALARAQLWFSHVTRLAEEVVLMAPRFDDHGSSILPSPLYGGWPEGPGASPACQSHLEGILAKGVQSAPAAPEQVPPVLNPKAEDVRGGVAIIKSVVTSPWVGFVRHRLGLTPFPDTVDGIDAATQGELVHRALERIWKVLRSRDALRAIPSGDLQALVYDQVRLTQEEDQILSAQAYGPGLAAVERQRAVDLLGDWLRLEGQRAEPFEVMVFEGRAEAGIGALLLSLRIDRIDRVTCADGAVRFLVIDYKSAASLKATSWDPDVLGEPQLPIYATFTDVAKLGIPRVDGIAFAKVAEGACDFVLRSNFADRLVPDRAGSTGQGAENWEATLAEWRKALAQAAQRFLDGDLSLDREKYRRSRFDRDLDPLVRPKAEVPSVAANQDPF